jgi:hypothetical protein
MRANEITNLSSHFCLCRFLLNESRYIILEWQYKLKKISRNSKCFVVSYPWKIFLSKILVGVYKKYVNKRCEYYANCAKGVAQR